MPRRRLKPSRTATTGFFNAAKNGGAFGGAAGYVALQADGTRMPEGQMGRVSGQLQDAAVELEALLFEAPGLPQNCRNEVHESLGLVMEALQMLGRARRSLERTSSGPAIDPRLTSLVPMLRA